MLKQSLNLTRTETTRRLEFERDRALKPKLPEAAGFWDVRRLARSKYWPNLCRRAGKR
jgi:hypothetical protein